MSRPERNGNDEGGSLLHLTLDDNRAALEFDQFAHQRETDAGTLERAAARAFHAMEPLKDSRKLLDGNSDAGVGDRDLHLLASISHGHGDASGQREFEGIREQVENNLLPHLTVEIDRVVERRAIDDEFNAGL